VPGDERFRLHKDVKAITNEQIIEISEIVQSSHHINTRVMRCVAEPMVKVALKGAEANGCRTQPYFWSRWDPSYWTPVTFFIESGSISESLTDETTRSLSLTCHSEHWTTFESFQNEISPFHTLLRVERGVEVATSTSTDPPSPGEPVTIWIPLGIYRVHKVNFNRDHTADIEAYSLEQVLKDFLYEKIPAPLASARPWMGLWEETWLPGGLDNTDPNARDWSHVTYELSNSITPDAAAKVAGETFQSGFQVGTSFARWTGIRDMLEARHFNLYVNRVGKPIVVRIPEPQDAPADWVPQEIQNQLIMNEGGGANLGNIVSRTEDFNRDGLFNTIVAYGEIEVESNADGSAGSPSKAGTPVVTIVTDDNPASPTYVGGPFGQIGIELHVESLLAAGKLEVEGKAKLARSKILTTRTNLSLLPNPTIEVGDRIKVHYPDGSYRFFIIESADIPLTVDSELSVQAFTYDNSRTLACIGIPTDIQISWGPTDSAIRLNFLGVDGATGYEWTSDAALFWNPIVTTNLPNGRVEMEITGLRPLTDYSIRLRTVMDNDYECPPIQLIDDEFGIARIPGSLLVAEAGWPGRFQDPMATPANIVMANLYGAFHILPLAGSLAGVNSPWDQGAYILMADGMEATWTGDRFVQRIG
jgi:hypothetical protein